MDNRKTNPSRERNLNSEKPKKSVPVLLHRDYWNEECGRHAKGVVINVDVAAAKNLIKEGKAERADPLPGEND